MKEAIKGTRETTRDGATKEGITGGQRGRRSERRLDFLKVIAVIGKRR